MKLSDIHNLIKDNYFIKNLSTEETLLIYEHAYQSIFALRDEEVDLNSVITQKLFPFNPYRSIGRLGTQLIEDKLSIKFSSFEINERLLLYRIAQTKVASWFQETNLYEFNTLRGELLFQGVYTLNMNGLAELVEILNKSDTFTLDLTALAEVIQTILTSDEYTLWLTNTVELQRDYSSTYILTLTKSAIVVNIIDSVHSYILPLTSSVTTIDASSYIITFELILNNTVITITECDIEYSVYYYLSLTNDSYLQGTAT